MLEHDELTTTHSISNALLADDPARVFATDTNGKAFGPHQAKAAIFADCRALKSVFPTVLT